MPEVFELHREMGCTRREFIAWLPGATRQAPFRVDSDKVTVTTHGGSVKIRMEQRPPRRMGGIALPVLAVTFCFRGLDKSARDDFLAYFDLYTRRGGG